MKVLLLVSPSAAKTYLAAVYINSASSLRGLADAARLSEPTVIVARRELADRGLFHCVDGTYILPPRPTHPAKVASELPSLEDRRMVVKSSCKILGVAETADYVRLSLAKLSSLLQSGVTTDEAIQVARYARATYDSGDRFRPYLNLLHIWSASRFPPLLAASKTTSRAATQGYRVTPPGQPRDDWDEAHARKLQERGLS